MKGLFLVFMISNIMLWADFGIQDQLEFHSKYQNLCLGSQDLIIYGRLDKVINLPKEWQLYLRLDVPYIWLWGEQKEIISIGNDGIIVAPVLSATQTIIKKIAYKEVGLSDIGTRFFIVTPHVGNAKNTQMGFGSEFAFPTAQEPDLGTGKYWARPLIGIKWDFPNLGVESSLALLFKYQFSFAGNKNRTSFQIFSFQPVFIYEFHKDWTLVIAPESQYNIKTGKWFVPASISVTKTFTKHFSASLAYQRGVVTGFPVFQDEVEGLVRYVF